jgi:hypothetical protein
VTEPEASAQKRKAEWQSLTYDQVRDLIGKIPGMPEEAVDPLTIAVVLCGPMPQPLRDTWRKNSGYIRDVLQAMSAVGYDRELLQALLDAWLAIEQRRLFSLETVTHIPRSVFFPGEFPDDPPSQEGERSLERYGPVRGIKEHTNDLLVLGMGVLIECGCPRAQSKARRTKVTDAANTSPKSAAELMVQVLEVAWSDREGTESQRNPAALNQRYSRAKKRLSRLPRENAISLLEAHKKKHSNFATRLVWVRRIA